MLNQNHLFYYLAIFVLFIFDHFIKNQKYLLINSKIQKTQFKSNHYLFIKLNTTISFSQLFSPMKKFCLFNFIIIILLNRVLNDFRTNKVTNTNIKMNLSWFGHSARFNARLDVAIVASGESQLLVPTLDELPPIFAGFWTCRVIGKVKRVKQNLHYRR